MHTRMDPRDARGCSQHMGSKQSSMAYQCIPRTQEVNAIAFSPAAEHSGGQEDGGDKQW